MLLLLLLSFLLLIPHGEVTSDLKWGKTGHRVVGDISTEYLSPTAHKEVKKIIGPQSIAIASIWMDQIRSDPNYNHTHDWHWVTIPDDMTYEETEKNPNGDLIKAIQTFIDELKEGNLSSKEEEEKLKMLIHLIGDIHQPMHVGTGKDMGGNQTQVEWFYEPSNLHRVWDSEMIDDTKLSYTEFSEAINHPSDEQVSQWQNSDVLDWTYEAVELREEVYDLPDDMQLSYEYQYKNRNLLNKQLLKGGIRLAGVLNDIYGER